MLVLLALFLAGLVPIVLWSKFDVLPPWTSGQQTRPLPMRTVLHRYLWYLTVAAVSGLVAGVVFLGIGGRLVMRLLAITADTEAQGRITEADEVVGEITLGGTIGFMIFVGVLLGTVGGFGYALVRRWLPKGRLSGLTFGLLLLVIFATRADPLRPENPDFLIVGPSWLAVVAFAIVVIGYGMLVGAIAGRFSRSLPLLRKDPKTLAMYVPPYLALGPFLVVATVPAAAGAGLAVLLARTNGADSLLESDRTMLAGRLLLAVAAAVALPGFVTGIAEIL